MQNAPRAATANSLCHVVIELFFAVLPLVVLWFFWPAHDETHPTSFVRGPEWSMTACILYGLSLTRFLLGISNSGDAHNPNQGIAFATISIIPIMGLVVSVGLISKTSHDTSGVPILILQFGNFSASLATFLILGGYGLSRSHLRTVESTT